MARLLLFCSLALLAFLALTNESAAQCVLALNATSPLDWQPFKQNTSIWLNFSVYDAVSAQPILNFNWSATLDDVPLTQNPFNASVGVHTLRLNVSAPGCLPGVRSISFYVLPERQPPAVPNIPVLFAIALIALFMLVSGKRIFGMKSRSISVKQ